MRWLYYDLFIFLTSPVAMVTSCVLPPCCFHGDQSVSCSSPFSVIQTPLPLPVDKVSTQACVDPLCLRASRRLSEIWMHATQLQIVCVFVGVHVCACVRLLSHTSGLGGPRHTHTHRPCTSGAVSWSRNAGMAASFICCSSTTPVRGAQYILYYILLYTYTIFNFILKSLRRKKIQNLRFCRVCKALRLICLSTYLTLGS